MENYTKKAVELMINLADEEKGHPEVIPFSPSKTAVSSKESKYFKRKIGGAGYAGLLLELSDRLTEDRRANIHSIMIVKSGEVIFEASAPAYSTNTMHLAHSMSKTITGIGIMMLVSDGALDLEARAISFFPEIKKSERDAENITVKDLLSMKSAVAFSEIGVVSESNWSEAFFTSQMKGKPGEKFAYNSMNSYILAEIIARVSGKSYTDFIKERLLKPLGIKN